MVARALLRYEGIVGCCYAVAMQMVARVLPVHCYVVQCSGWLLNGAYLQM